MNQYALSTDLEKRLVPQLFSALSNGSTNGSPPANQRTQRFFAWSRSGNLHLLEKSPATHHRNPDRLQAVQDPSEDRSLGQTPLSSQDAVLYTDGCASLASGSSGWCLYLTRAYAPAVSLWGPGLLTSQIHIGSGPFVRPTTQVMSVRFTMP